MARPRWLHLQLDLFRDWRPPAPPPPAPPPAAVVAPRRRDPDRALDTAIYARPDPLRVYRLSVSHGYQACRERWYWCSKGDLTRLISQGRALTVGVRSPNATRTLTDAQEKEVVETVLELGGVTYAATALGISECLVLQICRERGVAYPRASRAAAARAEAATRLAAWQARRAA